MRVRAPDALPPRRADRARADRLLDQPRHPPHRRAGADHRLRPHARRPAPRRRASASPRSATAPAAAVAGADLVILCVPVGAMGEVAAEIAPHLDARRHGHRRRLGQGRGDRRGRARTCPRACTSSPAIRWPAPSIPGPASGFAVALRQPLVPADAAARRPTRRRVADLAGFWTALGARVDTMDPDHHDLVLAVTSHVPHLIAYTMVGVADHLRRVTEQEVINYSAAGFRDFTRIAASDPTMWRDVFLANKDATLDILGRFTEELFALQRAIRLGDGDAPARLLHPHPRHPPRHHRGRPGHRRPGLRAHRRRRAGVGPAASALRQPRRRAERDRAEARDAVLRSRAAPRGRCGRRRAGR